MDDFTRKKDDFDEVNNLIDKMVSLQKNVPNAIGKHFKHVLKEKSKIIQHSPLVVKNEVQETIIEDMDLEHIKDVEVTESKNLEQIELLKMLKRMQECPKSQFINNI